MTKKLFGFQCPKCFISSGTASTNTADAPTCCGDVLMDAYEWTPTRYPMRTSSAQKPLAVIKRTNRGFGPTAQFDKFLD